MGAELTRKGEEAQPDLELVPSSRPWGRAVTPQWPGIVLPNRWLLLERNIIRGEVNV